MHAFNLNNTYYTCKNSFQYKLFSWLLQKSKKIWFSLCKNYDDTDWKKFIFDI